MENRWKLKARTKYVRSDRDRFSVESRSKISEKHDPSYNFFSEKRNFQNMNIGSIDSNYRYDSYVPFSWNKNERLLMRDFAGKCKCFRTSMHTLARCIAIKTTS